VEYETGRIRRVRYWEAVADKLSKADFRWGCSFETDPTDRVIFTADAYARDGRWFTVLAYQRLTAFLELHAAIHHQLNRVKIRYGAAVEVYCTEAAHRPEEFHGPLTLQPQRHRRVRQQFSDSSDSLRRSASALRLARGTMGNLVSSKFITSSSMKA
jgi:hypothetical protein